MTNYILEKAIEIVHKISVFLHTERSCESMSQEGGKCMDNPLGYFIKWMDCIYQIHTERRQWKMPSAS